MNIIAQNKNDKGEKEMNFKKSFALLLTLMLLAVSLVGCGGQELANNGDKVDEVSFPEENIKLIVPFSPGGAVDVTCRFLAEVAQEYLNGKNLIVENMPGGGAVVGQNAVAKAKPDGYTLLAFTTSAITNPMTKKTDFTADSFKPIAMYCYDPEVLVVPANSKYDTLEDFIAAAKEKKISLSTPGYSTSHHIAGLILEDKTGVKFDYIHNDGAPMQIAQLLGGHVECALLAFGEAQGQIAEGLIKALAVMDDKRNEDLKDVPTFKEKGIDINFGAFRGIAAPADTPQEVVDALSKAFEGMINDPEFLKNMEKAGYPTVFKGSDDFADYVDQTIKDLSSILSKLNKEEGK